MTIPDLFNHPFIEFFCFVLSVTCLNVFFWFVWRRLTFLKKLIHLRETDPILEKLTTAPDLCAAEQAALQEVLGLDFQVDCFVTRKKPHCTHLQVFLKHKTQPIYANLYFVPEYKQGYATIFSSIASDKQLIETINFGVPINFADNAHTIKLALPCLADYFHAHEARLQNYSLLETTAEEAFNLIVMPQAHFLQDEHKSGKYIALQDGGYRPTLKTALALMKRNARYARQLRKPYQGAVTGADHLEHLINRHIQSILGTINLYGARPWPDTLERLILAIAIGLCLYIYRPYPLYAASLSAVFFLFGAGKIWTQATLKALPDINVPAWKHIAIELAGPLPGFLLGLAIYGVATVSQAPTSFKLVGATFVLLNAVTLLPLWKTTGDNLVLIAVRGRSPYIHMAATILGCFGGLLFIEQSFALSNMPMDYPLNHLVASGLFITAVLLYVIFTFIRSCRYARLIATTPNNGDVIALVRRLNGGSPESPTPGCLLKPTAALAYDYYTKLRPSLTIALATLLGLMAFWGLFLPPVYNTARALSAIDDFDKNFNKIEYGESDNLKEIMGNLEKDVQYISADNPRHFDLRYLKQANRSDTEITASDYQQMLDEGVSGIYYQRSLLGYRYASAVNDEAHNLPVKERIAKIEQILAKIAHDYPDISYTTINLQISLAEAYALDGNEQKGTQIIDDLLAHADAYKEAFDFTSAVGEKMWIFMAHGHPQMAIDLEKNPPGGYQRSNLHTTLPLAWAQYQMGHVEESVIALADAVYRYERDKPFYSAPLDTIFFDMNSKREKEGRAIFLSEITEYHCSPTLRDDALFYPEESPVWRDIRRQALTRMLDQLCPTLPPQKTREKLNP